MWGAVRRRLVLFKFKGIMAFPVEQGDTGQGSQVGLEHSQSRRTFYLHPPEAADTVEVSIAASAAQGGVFIADAAPRELLFLSCRPGGRSLGLQGAEGNGERYLMEYGWEGHRRSRWLVKREGVEATQTSVSGAFLTSGSALQALARAWRVGSAGMLKPLASSRAASSVSYGQGKEVQLPSHGSGPPPYP